MAIQAEKAGYGKVDKAKRDEQSLGQTEALPLSPNPGFADETEPQWAPPEAQPEPLPIDPIMLSSHPSPIPS